MFLKMFLMCAAVTLVLGALAMKGKNRKLRRALAVLTVLALLPTMVLGLLVAGWGGVLHYPGEPARAINEGCVLGAFAMDVDEADEDSRGLVSAVHAHLGATPVGEAKLQEFSAVQTVALTHLDTQGWLEALEQETVVQLEHIVQTNAREEVFNADRTAYLEGITDRAFDLAYEEMLTRAEEYVVTEELDVNLSWTPTGWLIVMDEALLNALEGFPLGDSNEIVLRGNIAQRVAARLNTDRAEILDGLPLIQKTFTIDKNAVVAPMPDPNGFGSTTDPDEVLRVLEQAEDLIGDRTISWNPDIIIKNGSEINYYYDESILALQWKEARNGTLVTFGEVIIQDPSQIRRVFAGDQYRCWDWETPTQMSQRTNAVLGMTGDFYMYRAIGIVVYQGEVYRTKSESLHHLFFTDSGEMLMTESYELGADDVAAFVEEHDVNFSLAFGPILIENGEKLPMPNYLVGEFYEDYPRGAIGEVDPLHYIVMTVGHEGADARDVTLPEAQQYIFEKGVQKAYTLDGGRTANMTFNSVLTDDPNYITERTMSDMFCFVSAIPEEER